MIFRWYNAIPRRYRMIFRWYNAIPKRYRMILYRVPAILYNVLTYKYWFV